MLDGTAESYCKWDSGVRPTLQQRLLSSLCRTMQWHEAYAALALGVAFTQTPSGDLGLSYRVKDSALPSSRCVEHRDKLFLPSPESVVLLSESQVGTQKVFKLHIIFLNFV